MKRRALLESLELAVLYGGRSGERAVSLDSGRAVSAALRGGGYQPLPIDTAEPGWWKRLAGIDLAFNAQHGAGGEDGVTQGLLDALGVVGTGSGVLGCALAMDKLRCKQLWSALGLPTPEFEVVDASTDAGALLAAWGGAFIKPARGGSSLGMAPVRTASAFAAALERAATFDRVVLAERLVDGAEYTVAILGERTLPPIRIVAAGEFYDYAAKYQLDTTQYHIPCGLEAGARRTLCELARRAFCALDCSVWGRVDFMRDTDGAFQILEVNTVPGMTGHSLVPMAARADGLGMLELVEEVLCLSWQRARGGGRS